MKILSNINVDTAKQIKNLLDSPENDFTIVPRVYDLEPVQREFYGRFELALELLESLDQLHEANASDDSIIQAIMVKLEATLHTYGVNLMERAGLEMVETRKVVCKKELEAINSRDEIVSTDSDSNPEKAD